MRLNPDRAYVESLIQIAGTGLPGTPGITPTPGPNLAFPDNPANTQPADWAQIGAYAYPGQGQAGSLVPLAAAAEMADRTHSGDWDENLGAGALHLSRATPSHKEFSHEKLKTTPKSRNSHSVFFFPSRSFV